jgi:hypothetical protein
VGLSWSATLRHCALAASGVSWASDVDFSYYVGADNYEIRWPGNGSSFGTEFLTDASGGVTSLLVTSFSLSPAATTAVPEPATWAMLMLGLGAIGIVMRRRHRVSAQIQLT